MGHLTKPFFSSWLGKTPRKIHFWEETWRISQDTIRQTGLRILSMYTDYCVSCVVMSKALTLSRTLSGVGRVLSHLSRLCNFPSFIWPVPRWKQIRHTELNCLIYYSVSEKDVSELEVLHARTLGSHFGPVQFNVVINNHKEDIKGMLLKWWQAQCWRDSEYSKRQS